jgi:hypothetical protein
MSPVITDDGPDTASAALGPLAAIAAADANTHALAANIIKENFFIVLALLWATRAHGGLAWVFASGLSALIDVTPGR